MNVEVLITYYAVFPSGLALKKKRIKYSDTVKTCPLSPTSFLLSPALKSILVIYQF